MLIAVAIARRVRAPLSRILRNQWHGELCRPYSTAWPQGSEERRTLAYTVRRGDPELVGPASPTPRETKHLSDLDDMENFRMHMSFALFYRGREREEGVHPAGVIRRALSEALVYYYPLAGRLREIEDKKLVVDCSGQGVLFVQADADVQLADLEAAGPGLRPPFPCWDQMLFGVEGCSGVLDTPLMLIQVTRLLCGGFVLAVRFTHTMCDGIGMAQFLNGVSELARGLPSMTVTPVWSRELIKARSLAMEREVQLKLLLPPPPPPAGGDMVTRSFNFCASDVAKLKKNLPRVTSTTFEALAALVWRARITALQLPPAQEALLAFSVNIRGGDLFSLPAGYYGNAFVASMALVDNAELCRASLGDAVKRVRLAKAAVSAENVRSMVDEMVLLGRRGFVPANLFFISDARRLGLHRVDLGWGDPIFAGPAEPLTVDWTYLIAAKDCDGEDAVCVPVVLPRQAMLRFAAEVERSLQA